MAAVAQGACNVVAANKCVIHYSDSEGELHAHYWTYSIEIAFLGVMSMVPLLFEGGWGG